MAHCASYLNFNPKCYYGQDALSRRGMVTLKQPIKHGIIENFDDMEKIWYNIIVDKLKTTSEEHGILLSEHVQYLIRQKIEKKQQKLCLNNLMYHL